MFNKLNKVIMIVAILTTLTSQASADKGFYTGLQYQRHTGLGFSAKIDLTNQLTTQVVLDFLGDMDAYTAKAAYSIVQEPYFDLYGYSSVAMWKWNYTYYYGWRVHSENMFVFGGGTGIEYDLRGIGKEFDIPLFISAELGLLYVTKTKYYSNDGIGVDFNLALHYKF